MIMRPLALTLSLALVGCFAPAREDAGTLDEFDDDDLPSGSCRDTGTDTDPCDTEGTTMDPTAGDLSTTTGGAGEDQCQASTDCSGGFCAAAFDPVTLQRAPLACQFMCIPNLADDFWCGDDSACCDAQARCTQRGYCVR
jgi:hypothetical protein